MKRYTEKIRAALPGTRLELKEHTYAAVEGLRAICGIVDGAVRSARAETEAPPCNGRCRPPVRVMMSRIEQK